MKYFINIRMVGAKMELVVLLSCSALSLSAQVTCASTVVTAPAVVLPAAGVAAIEQNLCLPYTGETNNALNPKQSVTCRVRTVAVSKNNRPVSAAKGIVTPSMLRDVPKASVGHGIGICVSTSFRSSVKSLNESGIAVMPQANDNWTAIRRAGVPPNPDETDEDLNQGDHENGPVGDALLPLLLMACLFACYRKRHSRISENPEN